MKTKKTKHWIIVTGWNGSLVYHLDASKLDVNDEELSECIYEQIYRPFFEKEERRRK